MADPQTTVPVPDGIGPFANAEVYGNQLEEDKLPRVTPKAPVAPVAPTPAKPLTTTAPPTPTPPTPSPSPTSTEPVVSPYTPTPVPPPPTPPTEQSEYEKLVDQSSNIINDTKSSYNTEISKAGGMAAANLAAAGLGGSSVAPGVDEAAIQPLLQDRATALDTIYDNIQKNAQTLQAQDYAESEQNYQDKVAAQATARSIAQDNVKAMAANHLDWNQYKKTNPDNYNALVQSLGGDPNYADALFASSIPAKNVTQTWITGSQYNQLSVDPITGVPSVQSYNLGVTIPQSWTQEKISNNAVIYHSPNWDPSDPSTYQIFSIDPLTGLPTNQTGGNANPTMGDQTVQSVSDILSSQGVNVDPSAPIDPDNVTAIAQALIQHENSQLDPSLNNPGDVKYVPGVPGESDSGVKASDGGTFAKYDTPEDGQKAVEDLVTHAASQGTSFGDFVKSYTGTGSTQASADEAIIQHWVNNIKNGIATLANVPVGAKTEVSSAIDSTDVTSYTPLAASRFTTAANRIVSNYISMPAYQLTAGGQLYLGRINAALQTPGSVSDQDLLDSLTKLNTGGNAISDAQVKLITDGQSFSDWKSVAANKLANGGVLSDSQRQQIQELAQNIFKSYQTAYQPIYDQATSQLQAAGIPKAFWTIPDLNNLSAQSGISGGGGSDSSAPSSSASAPSQQDTSQLQSSGFTDNGDGTWSAPNGTVFSYQGGQWQPQQ